MQRKTTLAYFYLILTILLFDNVHSAVLTNICSDPSSCNCTLTNNTDLNIICNSNVSLTQLPTLVPNTLQNSVTQLRILSSITNIKGPLSTLPTNICSYPNLAILDLSSNNITGLLNTSELACLGSQLIHIDFSYNNINAIDKNFFQSNSKIQSINLSNNNLITMPLIDGNYFVNFPSTIISMDFSFNQIISVDFWPLFVQTGNTMIIDMSHNLIENYTNTVPISLEQFTNTPDPRIFYLNNNHLTYFSDLLLEQYGACSTINPISTAYFIVGISNVLLTNNFLRCDCESYQMITYINDQMYDFPDIYNGTALLTKATCSSPSSVAGGNYISTDFSLFNNCINYTLPNITDIFCSLYINDPRVTLTPPTYWPSTIITTTITTTTNRYGTSGNYGSSKDSLTSLSWYIILGVILGFLVVLAVIIAVCYLCKDRIFLKKYRSKFLNHVRTDGNNPNNFYESIIRKSDGLSQENLKLNGIKPRRVSMSTSTCDQGNGTQQLDDGGGSHSDLKLPREHPSWNDGSHPGQETQTNFEPVRSKPPTGRPLSTRGSQQKDTNDAHRSRKLSLSTAADIGTNTANVVKGIPIPSVSTKIPPIPSIGTDTSISELNVTSIPLVPSKRAKLLPQIKSGIYVDSTNENLLNTSAGALVTSLRQRRRSSMWFRRQNQTTISPLPARPQSMVAQKTIFDYDGSFDEDIPSIPTIESLTNKPSKPLRTVPLLNISVVPAWTDDTNDQE